MSGYSVIVGGYDPYTPDPGDTNDATVVDGECLVGLARCTAALTGAVTIKDGSTVIDNLPAGSAAGTTRTFGGLRFSTSLVINFADASDSGNVLLTALTT